MPDGERRERRRVAGPGPRATDSRSSATRAPARSACFVIQRKGNGGVAERRCIPIAPSPHRYRNRYRYRNRVCCCCCCCRGHSSARRASGERCRRHAQERPWIDASARVDGRTGRRALDQRASGERRRWRVRAWVGFDADAPRQSGLYRTRRGWSRSGTLDAPTGLCKPCSLAEHARASDGSASASAPGLHLLG